MDDLAGLDWNSPRPNSNANQASQQPALSFPSLKPTPSPSSSGRSTPFSLPSNSSGNQQAKLKVQPRSSTLASDSFAGLLSLNSPKPAAAQLSLQEQQRRLQEEKRRKDEEESRLFGSHFGAWDPAGSASASAPKPSSPNPQGDEDDILAAFKSTAPVDASSHFPPPKATPPPSKSPQSDLSARGLPIQPSKPSIPDSMTFNDDDDDPFGLGQLPQRQTPAAAPQPTSTEDDDDILGVLGRPVSQMPPPQRNETKAVDPGSSDDDGPMGMDPRDRAVAELVDMGFDASKAAEALQETEDGTNVQAAVGVLLNRAHEESRQKAQAGQDGPRRGTPQQQDRSRTRNSRDPDDSGVPAWMRSEAQRDSPRSRDRGESGREREKDAAQYASEFGASFLRSANSLWKTGQKKVQKAVADFQQDGDPSQPRWMREAQNAQRMPEDRAPGLRGRSMDGSSKSVENGRSSAGVTDEAAMLEAGAGRPTKPKPEALPHGPASRPNASSQSPWDEPDRNPFSRPVPSQPERRAPAGKLTREHVEEQSAGAYVSPARRKKATPVPEPDRRPSPLANKPSPSASFQDRNPFTQSRPSPKPTPPPRAAATPPRPKAPPRQIPPVSAIALTTSTNHRATGNSSFKRGDYTSAHASFTAALNPLPPTHPLTIVILCNRATTSLKIGDPKAAIADADSVLTLVGPAKGDGEQIDVPADDGSGATRKEMRDYWARAAMRKAEALEHLEKWQDAADTWRLVVEAGVGGAVSIQGRDRCDRAVGGAAAQRRPTPRATPRPTPRPRPATSAMDALAGTSGASTAEAVEKLREANRAAERVEDEKFALVDAVDARLTAWKGSRSDNLRALLGSLDGVLWEGAGWKKVNMAELVMPNKVKIVYMKAIAKVHPDKIPQDATTEQRMISAAVFSTLNDAWDKFKQDNGL